MRTRVSSSSGGCEVTYFVQQDNTEAATIGAQNLESRRRRRFLVFSLHIVTYGVDEFGASTILDVEEDS